MGCALCCAGACLTQGVTSAAPVPRYPHCISTMQVAGVVWASAPAGCSIVGVPPGGVLSVLLGPQGKEVCCFQSCTLRDNTARVVRKVKASSRRRCNNNSCPINCNHFASSASASSLIHQKHFRGELTALRHWRLTRHTDTQFCKHAKLWTLLPAPVWSWWPLHASTATWGRC